MIRSSKLPVSVGLLFSLLLGAGVATAEVSAKDTALARSLFREARKLMADNQYAVACPKLEESQRLDPGVGTQYNLADCWEHVGKTASAWALFLDVAAATRAAGQSERETLARQRAEALEGRLAKLRLRVEERHPALSITRDGSELGRASWSSEIPVDPGTTVIEASAPGRQAWKQQVTIPNSAKLTTVTVPELRPLVAPVAPVAKDGEVTKDAPVSELESSPAAPATQPAPAGKGQRVVALGLGGLGVVGAAVGTVFLLRYNSKNTEAKSICPTNQNCEIADQGRHDGLIEDARSSAPWVYVGFGAGGAALIAASVLYFTAPSEHGGSASARSFTVVPMAGPHEASAVLRGHF